MDWPNAEDALKRYQVMLDFIPSKKEKIRLLDFGCGTSQLYDYILSKKIRGIEYSGMDISETFIRYSRAKFPQNSYYCADILNTRPVLSFDYIVCNGVFTEKLRMDFEEMFDFMQKVVCRLFPLCSQGLAFNVMSKNVDWERPDLFHVPLDRLTHFLNREVSRRFTVRSDYGLYDYTIYLYREYPSVIQNS